MRAAIYARYSSENQREASIEDQVRICRARIKREGWRPVEVYSDAALSGASTLRPGHQNRLNADAEGQWALSRRELAGTERKIEAILRAIEDGVYTPATKDRLLELEHRRDELKRTQPPRPVARLHPRLADVYRDKVARLEAELNRPETRPEAAEALRALIEKIVLYPGDERGEVKAELYGEIAEIMALAENQNKNRTPGPGVRFSMVAGSRNRRDFTLKVAV